ncbi:MAG: mevalonate kinase [Bacteroidota bacterium]
MSTSLSKPIPAKILLFGEHTILRGSRALAMPLWSRSCSWQQGGSSTQQKGLRSLFSFLENNFTYHFDLARYVTDLDKGWYLASDIPVGYGLGSSASVCVAIFEHYATPYGKNALAETGPKAYFAQMESHFHGTSSGTDPLIIYERQSLALSPDGQFEFVEIPPLKDGWHLFLLDTQKARETGPIVNYFTHRYDTDEQFRTATDTQWTPATDRAIAALLQADEENLSTAFRKISQFQLDELPPMVLPSLHEVWRAGLNSGTYLLKICGAGGGGYCLGLTQDWEGTQRAVAPWSAEVIEW